MKDPRPGAGDGASGIRDYEAAAEGRLAALARELPSLVVEDGGEIARLGGLSPGCALCKSGDWDCLFITARCNLDCRFCCSAMGAKGSMRPSYSSFGDDAEEAFENYRKAGIRGFAFSGGEPFLDFALLAGRLSELKAEFPSAYFWAYTNGLLVDGERIDRLADAGLDELRFDLAATGYADPGILGKVEYAARRIGRATVEIPAIPGDREALLGSLPAWSRAGVEHLNLHELMRERGSNSERMEGDFRDFALEDGRVASIEARSLGVMAEAVAAIARLGLPLKANLCTLKSKLRQVGKRREKFARLRARAYEKANAAYLETVLVRRDDGGFLLVHPDEAPPEGAGRGDRIALRRPAPLSMREETRFSRLAAPDDGRPGSA